MVKHTDQKHIETSPDGFLDVSKRSGIVRLILILVIFFFIWSFFALAASIADPFPHLPSLWLFGRGGSPSLASELFNEILSSYFSVYAVAFSGLTLLGLLVSFFLTRELATSSAVLPDGKPAGRFIRSCAFSVPEFPLIDLSQRGFDKTPEYQILHTFGGPCFLKLPAHSAAVLQDKAENYRLVTTVKTGGENFQVGHQEILSAVIKFEDKHLIADFQALCRDGSNIHIRKMAISSSLVFTGDNLLFSNDEEQYEETIGIIAHNTLGNSWQDFMNERLLLEMSAILLNYSGREIMALLENEGNISDPKMHAVTGREAPKEHTLPSHGRLYQLPARHFRRPDKGIILRNRRRSILPELRKQDEEKQINSTPIVEKKRDFKTVLSQQLEDAFNSIFNIAVIQFNIIRTGDISIDEVHKL